MTLLFCSCKKEKIYKGYYRFTMDIGYVFEGVSYNYHGSSKDTFNIILVSSTNELLTFHYVSTVLNETYTSEEYLFIDKKNNIAGHWVIDGVGEYHLSGEITDFKEAGKIEGTVSCLDSHKLQPESLELETGVKAYGPFVLEKID